MTLSRRELLKRASAMAGVAAVAAACGPPPPLRPPPPPSGPRTIVVIIGDDMRFDFRTVLRNLNSGWVDCVNAAVEVPMCGPSRAAYFKGMYSSRTGVTGNSTTYLMNDADTIATRLRARGFKTVLSGKYLNDFPWTRPASYVPPGWNVFNAAGGSSYQPGGMWGSDYVFHVAAQQVLSTPRTTPLFLWVAPTEPHLPANPPARHASSAVNLPAKSPAFNEADVSDKPANQQFPPLSGSEIAAVDRDRLGIGRCLLGVNDGIGELMNALSASGRLNSAHMFFTSDNGYLLGEHRMIKKGEPYEEPSRIPFMVRWPGVIGRVERNLVSSIDLSATVCAIGGTTPPGSDGRNLTPLITTGAAVRDAAYIEPPGGGAGWSALRTTRYKFVEYGNGGRELYDLASDPWEERNAYFSPAYQSTVASLHSRLQSLKP
jgi:arylsulfatase A-like enzyme